MTIDELRDFGDCPGMESISGVLDAAHVARGVGADVAGLDGPAEQR
jgi:hypothetical protein